MRTGKVTHDYAVDVRSADGTQAYLHLSDAGCVSEECRVDVEDTAYRATAAWELARQEHRRVALYGLRTSDGILVSGYRLD